MVLPNVLANGDFIAFSRNNFKDFYENVHKTTVSKTTGNVKLSMAEMAAITDNAVARGGLDRKDGVFSGIVNVYNFLHCKGLDTETKYEDMGNGMIREIFADGSSRIIIK